MSLFRRVTGLVAAVMLLGPGIFGCAHAPDEQATGSAAKTESAATLEEVLASLAQQIRGTLVSNNTKRVAIPNLVTHAGAETELGAYLADKLTNALFFGKPELEVVDRIHLKSIVEESEIGAQIGDIQTIQSLGKVLGADALVVGTLTDLGDRYDVTLRMVETEKARVLATASGFIGKSNWVEKLYATQVVRPKPMARMPEPSQSTEAPAAAAPVEPPAQKEPEPAPPPSPKYLNVFENKAVKVEVSGGRTSEGAVVTLLVTNKTSAGLSFEVDREWSRAVWAGGTALPWGGSIDTFGFGDCKRIGDTFFVQPGATEQGTVLFRGVPPDVKRYSIKLRFGWKFENGSCAKSDQVVVYFGG